MSARITSAVTPGGHLRPHDDKLDDFNRYSGVGAVGMGFLTGDIDDDDDEEELYSKPSSHPPGLTPQGRPGPAVVSANVNFAPSKPEPVRVPDTQRIMAQPERPGPRPIQVSFPNQPRAPMRAPPPAALRIPQVRSPPTPGPMTPHPLQAPKTPITPAFARPRNKTQPSDVKFTSDAILRGEKEETLLARNTPKGAEFWRRFSVVVKEEQRQPGKLFKSSWLSDHQSRSFRMNLCIWITGLLMLAAIAGGGVLIWFLTSHNSVTVPKALGGSAGEGVVNSTSVVASSTTALPLHSVTGGLPPTSTPPIPADLAGPTTAPVVPGAIQKRTYSVHRRRMRRMVN